MDKIIKKLQIFGLIYLIIFLPEISQSQTINITKSSFLGETYNISIPTGYCNISKTRVGIFILNHLLEVKKKLSPSFDKTPLFQSLHLLISYLNKSVYTEL